MEKKEKELAEKPFKMLSNEEYMRLATKIQWLVRIAIVLLVICFCFIIAAFFFSRGHTSGEGIQQIRGMYGWEVEKFEMCLVVADLVFVVASIFVSKTNRILRSLEVYSEERQEKIVPMTQEQYQLLRDWADVAGTCYAICFVLGAICIVAYIWMYD